MTIPEEIGAYRRSAGDGDLPDLRITPRRRRHRHLYPARPGASRTAPRRSRDRPARTARSAWQGSSGCQRPSTDNSADMLRPDVASRSRRLDHIVELVGRLAIPRIGGDLQPAVHLARSTPTSNRARQRHKWSRVRRRGPSSRPPARALRAARMRTARIGPRVSPRATSSLTSATSSLTSSPTSAPRRRHKLCLPHAGSLSADLRTLAPARGYCCSHARNRPSFSRSAFVGAACTGPARSGIAVFIAFGPAAASASIAAACALMSASLS